MPSDAEPRTVRVAVIDSGIQPGHPHVGGIAGGVSLTADGQHADYLDRIGHGTAVAAAIHDLAPAASLWAVKVFDHTLAGSVHTLVRAVDWAADNGCHIINMSLGTPRLDHAARLHAAVERAREAGVVLVAAREDRGQQFLPGSLPGVIGVVVDWSCPRDRIRVERLRTGQVVCHASGYPRQIPGVPPEHNLKGVSFAVANTTGWLARAYGRAPAGGVGDPRSFVERVLIDNPMVPA